MDIPEIQASSVTGGSTRSDRPHSPEEAAQKFEEVLARQFVQVMTKDLFKNNLSGENGPGWIDSYSDTQRDILTDALTRHLVDQGTLGLSDMILRRWNLPQPDDGSSQTADLSKPSTKHSE